MCPVAERVRLVQSMQTHDQQAMLAERTIDQNAARLQAGHVATLEPLAVSVDASAAQPPRDPLPPLPPEEPPPDGDS